MIAALVTALAPVPPLYAATQGNTLADYAVTTWTEKEGLPAGRIRAIAQGFEGYLWLGLETGLVRFDGVRFVPWAGAPLPPGTVWSMLTARDHSLFLGLTGATPVARIRDGQTTLYGAASGLPNTLVVSLYEDRGGAVWAATLAGLFRFDGRRWARVDLGQLRHRVGDRRVRGRRWAVVDRDARRGVPPRHAGRSVRARAADGCREQRLFQLQPRSRRHDVDERLPRGLPPPRR